MTLVASAPIEFYTIAGATTPLEFNHSVETDTDLIVYAAGVELVLGTDYTVDIAADFGSATVTPTAATVSDLWTIFRDMPMDQDTALPSDLSERGLDRIMRRMQGLRALLERAVLFEPTELRNRPILLNELPEGHFYITDADGNMIDGGSGDDIAGASAAAASAAADAATATEAAAAAAQSLADINVVVDQLAGLLGGLADPYRDTFAVSASTPSITVPVDLDTSPLVLIAIDGVLQQSDTFTTAGHDITPTSPWPGDGVAENLEAIIFPQVTFPVASYARKTYVQASDFCAASDAVDAFAGLQATLTAGYGREIVIDNPYGGIRTYRSLSRGNGGLILPRKGRIIFGDGALVDFSAYAPNGSAVSLMRADGAAGYSSDLASDLEAGDRTFEFSSVGEAANYAPGDVVAFQSDELFVVEELPGGCTKGEWNCIAAISGTTGTLAAQAKDTYLVTENARIVKIDPAEVTVENVQLIGCGQFDASASGDRGLRITLGQNCHVKGGELKWIDRNGIYMDSVWNGSVRGVKSFMETPGANTNTHYPISVVTMSENMLIENCEVRGGTEGFALSITSGAIIGPTRDVTHRGNRASGCYRSGFVSHNGHIGWNIVNNVVEDCEQGVDVRIGYVTIEGNRIMRTGRGSGGLDTGVNLGSGAKRVLIANNYFEDVRRGVYKSDNVLHLSTASGIHIKNNVFLGLAEAGVTLRRFNTSVDGSDAAQDIQDMEISGNYFEFLDTGETRDGTPITPSGMLLEGKYRNLVIANNVFAGGAPGNTGPVVSLNNAQAAADGIGSSLGPIAPTIVGNTWHNFITPIIGNSTGVWNVRDNRNIIDTALPGVVVAANTISPSLGGDVMRVTAGGTLNKIAFAAQRVGARITLVLEDLVVITHASGVGGSTNDIYTKSGGPVPGAVGDTMTLVSTGTIWREV